MELAWLEDFLALARERNFSRAAEVRHISQPAFSRRVRMLEDWRACMLRHPWSAALLPRRALGANILARLELLSRTLSRAGIADENLNAAIWSIWNHVMGATVTLANFDLSDDARKAATQRRPEGTGGDYPAIEGSRLLLDEDWDGAFRKGLGFLLDGLPLKKVD